MNYSVPTLVLIGKGDEHRSHRVSKLCQNSGILMGFSSIEGNRIIRSRQNLAFKRLYSRAKLCPNRRREWAKGHWKNVGLHILYVASPV